MNEISVLTLYPSKIKILLLLLLSIIFTIGGIWMVIDGIPEGWLGILFFGIGCVVFPIMLLPNSSYLRLSKKGFEVRSLFRGEFINWNEVDGFEFSYIGRTNIGRTKMVIFRYSPKYNKHEIGRIIVKIITGDFDGGALPDTYGKSGEELAKLLNERKKNSLKIEENQKSSI